MTRQTIEFVDERIAFSDDNWETVYVKTRRRRFQFVEPSKADLVAGFHLVTNKEEADRIRYIASFKYGGGRDDPRDGGPL